MTRYYVCARCAARWQVARNWQIVQEGAGDAASRDANIANQAERRPVSDVAVDVRSVKTA
jgi:hypothetical protein